MQAVGYLRVSTSAQDTEAQRAAIEAAAAGRGDTIAEWFAETRGAHTIRRPELRRLRQAVAAGSVRRVYVFRLDRLARSGVRDTFRVLDDFRAHGCALVTVADGLPSTDGPWGDVVIAVLAAAAQIELEALRERLRVSRLKVEARGGKWGRPKRLTRHDWPQLLELDESGFTVREIAQRIKCPRSTVGRALAAARAAKKLAESAS